MTKINTRKPGEPELRSYILEHREDERAFQIYLDRVTAEPG
ncbi:DUF6887 family protein [Microcystis aeruginosa]